MFSNELEDIQKRISGYRNFEFSQEKYSYVIVKPNGEKHFHAIEKLLQKQQFTIVHYFAIKDYGKVNLILHPETSKHRYINPINRMYSDFYGNYAIMLLISKKNISYQDFVLQVYQLKKQVRHRFELDYVSFVFDIAKLGMTKEQQVLKILKKDGTECEKERANDLGTYIVILPNSFHSPDNDLEITIEELHTLFDIGVISNENMISESMLENIRRYETFAFLKDM